MKNGNGNGSSAEDQNTAVTAETPGTDKSHTKEDKQKGKKAKSTKKATAKPAKKAAKKEAAKPAKKAARKTVTPKKSTPKAATKAKPAKKASDIRTADNSNRDFTRIRFNGEDLPKGRAVLAVITEEAGKKGMTLSKLQERFPDELMRGPWGVIRELAPAKRASGSKKLRYFLRDEHVLNVGGKKVVVCNQWSSDGFKNFAKHAKSLGYSLNASRAK
jgi:hypothetical protein